MSSSGAITKRKGFGHLSVYNAIYHVARVEKDLIKKSVCFIIMPVRSKDAVFPS